MVLEMLLLLPEVKVVLVVEDYGQAALVQQAILHPHHHHRVIKVVQELRYQVLQITGEAVAAVLAFMVMMVVVVAAAAEAQALLVLSQAQQHTMQVVEVVVVG